MSCSEKEEFGLLLGDGSHLLSEGEEFIVGKRIVSFLETLGDVLSVHEALLTRHGELGVGVELAPVGFFVNLFAEGESLSHESLDGTVHEDSSDDTFHDFLIVDGFWDDLANGNVHDLGGLIGLIDALEESGEVESSNT